MRRPVLVATALLLCVACRAGATAVRSDLCADMGHLTATVDDLATYGASTRIAVVRGALEKMDPTFGNLSRSGLADPDVLDRLLRAHVGYRDLLVGMGDDQTFGALGPGAPGAAATFRSAFRSALGDLDCSA